MKNVKLTGTFSVKKRTKRKIVESEMWVWVMNLPINYCWLVYKFKITLKVLNIFYILKQYH